MKPSHLFACMVVSIGTAKRSLGAHVDIFPVAITVTGKYLAILAEDEGMEEFYGTKAHFLSQSVAVGKLSIQVTFLVHALPLALTVSNAGSFTFLRATAFNVR